MTDAGLLQYFLGGSAGLLLIVTSILFKNLIEKLEEGNKILSELRIDMAVLKTQSNGHNSRFEGIEMDIKHLKESHCGIKI